MRPVGVGVSDPLNDGHLALVVQVLERRGVLVEPQRVVHRKDVVGLEAHHRPYVVVYVTGIRHDGVHEVVASSELENDQDLVFTVSCHLELSSLVLGELELSRCYDLLQHAHDPGVLVLLAHRVGVTDQLVVSLAAYYYRSYEIETSVHQLIR